MFSFTKQQKVFEIGGIKIGGQPGHHPTALFGGIFFTGAPQFEEARKNIEEMISLGDATGNPAIPDFFIRHEKYIPSILDFIESVLPPNYPFSIDILDPSLKPCALQALGDRELLSRTIYNSIHIGLTRKEQDALGHNTPGMAIILAFNPKDNSPDGKIEILENSAHLLDRGLLAIAEDLGIKNILIDTAATAPGENSGSAIASIPVIKEEYGFPTGCAIHNVVEKSPWLKSFKGTCVDASSNINISLFGGDFALYGPLKNSPLVFPIIAWEDILISEYAQNYFGVQPHKNHPCKRLFHDD